jgi:hypothetical protein
MRVGSIDRVVGQHVRNARKRAVSRVAESLTKFFRVATGGGVRTYRWVVATRTIRPESPSPLTHRAIGRRLSAPAVGALLGVALMAAAVLVPPLTGWRVHVTTPPLAAGWDPRAGRGTLPALVLALLAGRYAIDLAARVSWGWLLVGTFVAGVGWMLALAYVDGSSGIARPLDTPFEYLRTARSTTDVAAVLHDFIGRIASTAPDRWPAHVAGHPPGALLTFVFLDRIGLGSGLAAGMAVVMVSATTAVAVLVTLRVLGASRFARRAAPFLVFGPAAIWQAVSADALFAAVAAWGLAALAAAATGRRYGHGPGWRLGRSVVAGLLLGWCLMLSYGLVLLGILAVTVLWLASDWTPVAGALASAMAVVAAFAALGVPYWTALTATRQRYWAGLAAARPTSYWLWADLAALLFCVGPLAAAGLARCVRLPVRWRRTGPRPAALVPVAVGAAALVTVLAADLSLMSKAEVERIWLPFVPWLLLPVALLSIRWRRAGLVAQVLAALLVQHLLYTMW